MSITTYNYGCMYVSGGRRGGESIDNKVETLTCYQGLVFRREMRIKIIIRIGIR